MFTKEPPQDVEAEWGYYLWDVGAKAAGRDAQSEEKVAALSFMALDPQDATPDCAIFCQFVDLEGGGGFGDAAGYCWRARLVISFQLWCLGCLENLPWDRGRRLGIGIAFFVLDERGIAEVGAASSAARKEEEKLKGAVSGLASKRFAR